MSEKPATVVDYDAWNRGYMPPSEHILIDQLSYRGARVVLGSDWGDMAIWVVMRGKSPTPAMRKIMRKMIELAMDATDPPQPDEKSNLQENLAGSPEPGSGAEQP